jgi:hypothetical protein
LGKQVTTDLYTQREGRPALVVLPLQLTSFR